MRLLHTTTLDFQEFIGDLPLYAILSHTWEREEVSYADMCSRDEAAQARRGFQKIAKCCKQAQRDGYEYVWIDTVCIDKSSSAELSEAINSMYNWYHQSSVCYVYLSDMEFKDQGYNWVYDITDTTTFETCRWFGRGWTLQELIAPRNVEFFSRTWKELGTKRLLEDLLHTITGVNREVLQGASPLTCSAAERMSWASGRTTTRVEDTAYCLLGIFNINMPLLYGEGERAFLRLQMEILRQNEDYSLFAWPGVNLGSQADIGEGPLASQPSAFGRSSLGNMLNVGRTRQDSSLHLREVPVPLSWSSFVSINPNGGASANAGQNTLPTQRQRRLFGQVFDPAAVTNRGLQLRVLAKRWNEDGVYVAWTFCIHAEEDSYLCAFFKESPHPGPSSTYAPLMTRMQPLGLVLVSREDLELFDHRTLFVQTNAGTPRRQSHDFVHVQPTVIASYGIDDISLESPIPDVIAVEDRFPEGVHLDENPGPLSYRLLAVTLLKYNSRSHRIAILVGSHGRELWCAVSPGPFPDDVTATSLYGDLYTEIERLYASSSDRASELLATGDVIVARLKRSPGLLNLYMEARVEAVLYRRSREIFPLSTTISYRS